MVRKRDMKMRKAAIDFSKKSIYDIIFINMTVEYDANNNFNILKEYSAMSRIRRSVEDKIISELVSLPLSQLIQ
jgi:hypothetical protein